MHCNSALLSHTELMEEYLWLSWQFFYQILFSNPFILSSKNTGSLNFIRQIHMKPLAKFLHSTGLNGKHSIILEWYWRSSMQLQKNLSCPEWKQQAGNPADHVLKCSVQFPSLIRQQNVCFWEPHMSVSLNSEPDNETHCLKTMYLLQKHYLQGSQPEVCWLKPTPSKVCFISLHFLNSGFRLVDRHQIYVL